MKKAIGIILIAYPILLFIFEWLSGLLISDFVGRVFCGDDYLIECGFNINMYLGTIVYVMILLGIAVLTTVRFKKNKLDKKNLNNQSIKILKQITKKTQNIFPDIITIIVWGSGSTPEFDPNISDLDCILILPEANDTTSQKLKKIINNFKSIVDLDLLATTQLDLQKKDLTFIGPEGKYPLHKMDHYQLINVNKIILGDENILNKISPVTIDKALDDIIPYVSNKISDLQNEIKQKQNGKKFIINNLNHLLVIVRTIYSIEKKDITSKTKALQYLCDKYPDLKSVLNIFKNIYLKNKVTFKVSKPEIINFLKFAQSKIK